MVPPIVYTRYIRFKAFTLNNDYFNLYFKQIQFYSASFGLIYPDQVWQTPSKLGGPAISEFKLIKIIGKKNESKKICRLLLDLAFQIANRNISFKKRDTTG